LISRPAANRSVLITGTDTGVGKTYVGCGLAGGVLRRGFTVAPFKPAETGCAWDAETKSLVAADAELLRQACQTAAPLETICPYRFRAPLAPWMAAQQEGQQIQPSRLAESFAELAAHHDVVLVESAGGILVPLAEKYHYGELARALALPVLVVASSRLGVINQTLLTLEYLDKVNLRTLGVVLNHAALCSPALRQPGATPFGLRPDR
jgi:dethiobiotin synthetase